ncbi:EG45-like domain containing protein [Silene latifolia]|uniref:EG45-like domain containing protein n=1 Tax=Silene latifolia TaxID=37657 RepID=UPI003D785B0C
MRLTLLLLCIIWLDSNLNIVLADVGTAALYRPPYLPTRCSGYSEEQLPENGFFASVGEGLWNDGAACGRQYQVRCISGPHRPCKNGNIVATVVDFCRNTPCPATLVFNDKAFSAISKSPKAVINIEFAQI